MPRDIPVGNGSLLVTFDELYRIRDLYAPRVGKHNHTNGHVQRFGVWTDGEFAWIEDDSWTRSLRYKPDTLVTEVLLRNEKLGLEMLCHDSVDFHEAALFRQIRVRDLRDQPRDVRVFFHIDLSINETAVGDTANYDPSTNAVVLYKDNTYFLVNAGDARKRGVDHWAIGAKRVGGAEGTWRDAEDGQLGRNAISQGSVDATVGFNLELRPGGEAEFTSTIVCGDSYETVKRLDERIWTKGPDKMVSRTEAYWRLWCRKEPIDTSPLPEPVRDLFSRSQLILRTQIDNGGAIIAANDSDITHFAGDHYSYCWMRDGALVAQALIRSGQSELSRAFFRFAAGCIEPGGYFLHKYTPEGRLASSWHPWMIDGEKILPIQQDETALTLWALRLHFETFRDVEFIKPLYSSLIARPAEWMLEHRDHNGLPKPSWDLWEERRGVHLFTCAATVAGLRAASLFAEDFGEPERAVAFAEGAERMRGALKRHMYREDMGVFARMAVPLDDGTYRLDLTQDASSFSVCSLGGFDPNDPPIRRAMEALASAIEVKTEVGGSARYERDYYHQVENEDIETVPGNPWIICTLWGAQHRILAATSVEDLEPAMRTLEWAVEKAAASGVLAEQYHPYTGQPISVSPLTWSHAEFVVTCMRLLSKRAELLGGAPVSKKKTVAER